MKKLLLLLLIAPVLGFGQVPFQIEGTIMIWGDELYCPYPCSEYGGGFVVPQGKIYQLNDVINGDMSYIGYLSIWNNNFPENNYSFDINKSTLLSEGTRIELKVDGPHLNSFYEFLVYDVSQLSLAYNNRSETTPTLYPNPTSSLLALNSEKEYDIEVYDMAGNKVMALTGNTIDMSDLSSATYIVKALDKIENEEVSYKVVKN